MTNYILKSLTKERLDEMLRKELPKKLQKEISNSKIRRLIISGNIIINSKPIFVPSFVLYPGTSVSVRIDEEKLFFEKAPDDISFELTKKDVLFEDESIIVVNKPAFFPTEAGITASRDNLHAAVIRYLHKKNPELKNPPYAGIMHRLDRETSGVILFTKSRAANKNCHSMFENHTAKKTYVALVTSEKELKEGEKFSVSMCMGRISGKSQRAKWGNVKGGLESKTDFLVMKKLRKDGKDCFLIECKPLTGRTHQIRVHLSSIALPILGDELYGGEKAARIYLHAKKLEFPHPITGKTMIVVCEAPQNEALKT